MEITGDEIAELVQRQFDRLPHKRKPQNRGHSIHEWVPLSGIVAQGKDGLKCIALGTGMKCLPQIKISQAQGVVLHDWHAEIVAIRSFNYFLLKECEALARSGKEVSQYVRRRGQSETIDSHFQPFMLHEDISLHMYCSEAPCGDASMELTIAAQDDPTPWALPPSVPVPLAASTPTAKVSTSASSSPFSAPSVPFAVALPGRAYFSHLSQVRRKPSRPDAPPTLSKSCSDKLSLKQATSLLSGPVSLLICPSKNAHLCSLTVPKTQYSASGCKRAFTAQGRMAPLVGRRWDMRDDTDEEKAVGYERENGYAFRPFELKTTKREFCFSRRQQPEGIKSSEAQPMMGPKGGRELQLEPQNRVKGWTLIPSNLATCWTPHGSETLIGGVLQGRKQFDPRGASVICRKKIWRLVKEIATTLAVTGVVVDSSDTTGTVDSASENVSNLTRSLGVSGDGDVQGDDTGRVYAQLKADNLLETRRRVKEEATREALKGWARNEGDDGWDLVF